MVEQWRQAEDIISQVTVYSTEDNDPVTIKTATQDVRCIGIGTDAAVFTIDTLPGYAFKVYSDMAIEKKMRRPTYMSVCEGLTFSSLLRKRRQVYCHKL